MNFQFCFGDFGKQKLEGRRIGERENELNQGNLENFFAFQFCFEKIFDESIGRFWKTKVGGKKNWRKRERELDQGNLENFLSNSIFDENIWRFWKTKVGSLKILNCEFEDRGKVS